jgi:LPXTG-motif cell wall-anchored protein
MYGPKVLGASTVTGAALLPNTGSNRPLFIAAATLLVGGLVALVVSKLVAHKG